MRGAAPNQVPDVIHGVQQPTAKRYAWHTWSSLAAVRAQIRSRNRSRRSVNTLSKFTAQVRGNPSSSVSGTSVGMTARG